MKEQILQKLIEYLENTKDFILEQTPEILQQTLRYEKVSAYINAALMIVLLTMAIVVGWYSWKNPSLDTYGSRSIGSIMGMYIPGCLSLFFFVQLCCAIDQLMKIYIAPKYFLIKLLMNM